MLRFLELGVCFVHGIYSSIILLNDSSDRWLHLVLDVKGYLWFEEMDAKELVQEVVHNLSANDA